jgi:nucleotide-binding universal stress UspA family protein
VSSHRILVPLDGHPASETALPAAGEQARISGAGVYLLYVVSTPAPIGRATPRYRAAIQRGERYLTAMRQRIAADFEVEVSSAVWSGSPAAAIVKAADLLDADLIVMARGGLAGPPRKLVGSVVERVLRGTRRHVLVVTPADATVDTSIGDAAPAPASSRG